MSIHITKKAISAIVFCLIIIISGYLFYGAKAHREQAEQELVMTNPTRVTPAIEDITATPWVWEYTLSPNGDRQESVPGKFILTLNKEGKYVTSTTDCNQLTSTYLIDGSYLSFEKFGSTKMACEGSIENIYKTELENTMSYAITGNKLHLNLSRDAGTMIFSPFVSNDNTK